MRMIETRINDSIIKMTERLPKRAKHFLFFLVDPQYFSNLIEEMYETLRKKSPFIAVCFSILVFVLSIGFTVVLLALFCKIWLLVWQLVTNTFF